MRSLRRFLRLPSTDRRLLVKAALLLEAIKVALRLLPFRVLRRLVADAEKTPIGLRWIKSASAEKVAWAVETASRIIPGEKTCLTQALAAQVLLTRRGYPALLHIGIVKNEEGEFQAHAWVECEGKVVIGGHELERYTPLAPLEGNRT
jgi:hypothetical protein